MKPAILTIIRNKANSFTILCDGGVIGAENMGVDDMTRTFHQAVATLHQEGRAYSVQNTEVETI